MLLVWNCIEISDIYEKFMEYKENGLFEIKPLASISKKELNFAYNDIKATIDQYQLKNDANNQMSQFIMNHFPQIWFE